MDGEGGTVRELPEFAGAENRVDGGGEKMLATEIIGRSEQSFHRIGGITDDQREFGRQPDLPLGYQSGGLGVDDGRDGRGPGLEQFSGLSREQGDAIEFDQRLGKSSNARSKPFAAAGREN